MKKFLVLMVILALMVFPTIAFAAEVPVESTATTQESIVSGDIEYNGELDTQEVTEVKYVGDEGCSLYSTSSTLMKPVGSLEKDVVLYVDDIISTEENGENIVWCYVKVDDSGNFYYVNIDQTKAISSVDSGYSQPVRTIKNSSDGESSASGNNNGSGGTSGSYAITYYCSACNSPRGNSVALSGSHAFVGSCATNSFPLGSTIHIEGYGDYYVNDRVGRSGVIDIYTGDTDTCTCSGRGRANAYIIG